MKLPAPGVAHTTYILTDEQIKYLHLHDCLEVGICRGGSGIFVVEDKILPFHKGSLSVVSSREVHRAQSARGTASQWDFLFIDPARLGVTLPEESNLLDSSSLCGPEFKNILSPSKNPRVRELIEVILREMQDNLPGRNTAVRGLVVALLIQLHRLTPKKSAAHEHARTRMERVMPALERLANLYDRPLNMEELANSCHMSPTHFRRLFHEAVGKSPLQYLTHLRIQMAAGLLREGKLPITEISMRVGYQSLSSFHRHFRQVIGISPREHRDGKSARKKR